MFLTNCLPNRSTPRNTSITDGHNRDMCSRSDRVFRDEVLWCLLTRDKWTYRNEGMHELNNKWFKYRLIMLRSWQEWWIFRCTISNGLFSTPRQLFLILSSPMVLWGRKYAFYFQFIGVQYFSFDASNFDSTPKVTEQVASTTRFLNVLCREGHSAYLRRVCWPWHIPVAIWWQFWNTFSMCLHKTVSWLYLSDREGVYFRFIPCQIRCCSNHLCVVDIEVDVGKGCTKTLYWWPTVL